MATCGPPPRAPVAAVAIVLGGLLASACEAPDRPPQLPGSLPAAFLEHTDPDTVRTVRVADGVWYRYVWSPRGPWAIHLVEADLLRCELGLEVVRASAQGGKAGGHERVSEMIARAGREGALVGVNGDFFTPEGTPLGPEVTADAVRTLRTRPVLGWRPGRDPWIGTARVEGGVLSVGGWQPDGVGKRAAVVGGYPELLDAGARVGDLLVSENPNFAATRHPRTAVGYEPARAALWLAVVDGRQGGYSAGMTLPELAELFETLGVPEALNLDGGGSSVMVVRGRAASRPSDEEGERAVVNALILRMDESYCGTGGR